MRQERSAGRRQRHAARAPIEERNAEVLLELAHALGQRRLAHRERACRRAQVARAGDGEKGAQQAHVTKQWHYHQLWIIEQIEFYSMPRRSYANRLPGRSEVRR